MAALRILYASDLLGPHDYRFLAALLEMGHKPTLVTYLHDIDRLNFTRNDFDVRTLSGLEIVREASLCAVPVVGRGPGRFLQALRHRRLMARRVAHFRSVVERVKPDQGVKDGATDVPRQPDPMVQQPDPLPTLNAQEEGAEKDPPAQPAAMGHPAAG